MNKLTQEQNAVVHHPLGKHARVLAVAGSGKTTTMVQRVKYLVQNQNISPKRIGILMFNRRARIQFEDKLAGELEIQYRPEVNTFHSFSYKLINLAVQMRLMPAIKEYWIGDREELVLLYVHKAINELVREEVIEPDSIDPDEVVENIGLWKGSLIPPSRAGHRSNPNMPLIYERFEILRLQKNALTFDDFVPIALQLLETRQDIQRDWVNKFDSLIVDEYQDVNYGQQRLIEVIAGQHADIMVVGDDDQTIYEWRGARPSYIIQDFKNIFQNKTTIDYPLTRTFRFGPLIAQCAQNMIEFNTIRNKKSLIANQFAKETHIHVIEETSEQPTNVYKELANQVVALVREHQDPKNIIVLGRMFSQFVGLEAEFLSQKIPYRVIGRSPFFERREIVVLLSYLRLALYLDYEANQTTLDLLLSIANVPNRKLSKDTISNAFKSGIRSGKTVQDVLQNLAGELTPLTKAQQTNFMALYTLLKRLNEIISKETTLQAGTLLTWLIETLDYFSHFDSYYGSGENSEDRKRCVESFCKYANDLHFTVVDFVKHIRTLDTTHGVPEDEQIVMTTVFRVKGEEFDYVFIPTCVEGYMPSSITTENEIYDKQGIVAETPVSHALESERRLFYVAITRARKAVFIGTSSAPQQGNQSNSGQIYPSRFIHEAQLNITQKVMSLVQDIALAKSQEMTSEQTNMNLVRKLFATLITQYAGYKCITENVVSAYLPALGLPVPPNAAESIRKIKATPFEYPAGYDQLKALATQKTAQSVTVSSRQSKWWQDGSENKMGDIPF